MQDRTESMPGAQVVCRVVACTAFFIGEVASAALRDEPLILKRASEYKL